MPLTLWRGDQLLGSIHLRASSNEERIEGVLLPAGPDATLASLRQTHLFVPGHIDAVMQHPIAPDVVEDRFKRPPTKMTGPVALELVARGQSPGVPLAEQLHVRDADGQSLHTPQITLLEHRPMPEHPDPELATLPPSAIVSGRVWLIWATRKSSRNAT